MKPAKKIVLCECLNKSEVEFVAHFRGTFFDVAVTLIEVRTIFGIRRNETNIPDLDVSHEVREQVLGQNKYLFKLNSEYFPLLSVRNAQVRYFF